jgi:hypothetical protein
MPGIAVQGMGVLKKQIYGVFLTGDGLNGCEREHRILIQRAREMALGIIELFRN